VFYIRQLGVNMKKMIKIDNTPDGKLERAAEHLEKAHALLRTAEQLAREAGVPLVADLAMHSATLTDQAAKLAEVVRFNADSKDLTRELPSTISGPLDSDDRATVKSHV
jgi:hypothetical protein